MGREEWSMTERKKICRDCYKELTESGARLGVCRNCAGKEVKKLRKRLIVSFLVGAALVGSVLAFRNHICSVYYFQKPGGDVVVPLFFGNVLVNDQFFFDMFYPSRTGGILFLDELPEMSRGALEALRQPLEERQVTISRVYGTCSYPADFQLVAAMNPCRCGHYPDLSRCTCTAGEVSRYLGKISGPLLDRMDICVEAQAVTYEEMEGKAENESSASIRARVEAARAIQRERFKGLSIRCNGEMGGGQIRRFCPLNKEESEFMEHIFFSLGISVRMYGKILKVARTAADLDGREQILTKDLSEAVSYVRIRQRYWKNG